jgi:hypothetical protein
MNIILSFCNKAVDYKKDSSVGVHGAQYLMLSVEFCRSLCVLLPILAHLATKGHICFLTSLDIHRMTSVNILIYTEFAEPNDPQLGRKHLWNLHYKDSPFRPTAC